MSDQPLPPLKSSLTEQEYRTVRQAVSDTPRTDAIARKWSLKGGGTNTSDASPEAKELYKHARKLEREVSELLEALKRSRDETIEWVAGQTKVQHCAPEWSLTDAQIRALKGKP